MFYWYIVRNHDVKDSIIFKETTNYDIQWFISAYDEHKVK